MNKLPAGATVSEAYRAVFAHWRLLLSFTWAPLLLATIVHTVSAYWRDSAGVRPYWTLDSEFSAVAVAADSVEELLVSVVSLLVLVPSYRLFLLGAESSRADLRWPGAGIYLNLLGFLVAVELLVSGPAFVLLWLSGSAETIAWDLSLFAGFCLFIWCIVKLTFLSPVLCLGRPWGLAERWHETDGNFWRLLLAFVVALLPFVFLLAMIIASSLFGLGVSGNPDPVVSVLFSFTIAAVGLVMAWFVAAVAVTTYAYLVGYPARGVALPAAEEPVAG